MGTPRMAGAVIPRRSTSWRRSVWTVRRQWEEDGKQSIAISVKVGFLRLGFVVPSNLILAFHEMLWSDGREFEVPLATLIQMANVRPVDDRLHDVDGQLWITEDNCGAEPWEGQ